MRIPTLSPIQQTYAKTSVLFRTTNPTAIHKAISFTEYGSGGSVFGTTNPKAIHKAISFTEYGSGGSVFDPLLHLMNY